MILRSCGKCATPARVNSPIEHGQIKTMGWLERRAEKWEPAFGEQRRDNKELDHWDVSEKRHDDLA
jgi:hypothetical protein